MTRGLLAAGAIVVLANGWLLGNVVRNRATVVERVELTEAELPLEYATPSQPVMRLRFSWIDGIDVATAPFSEAQLRTAGFDLPPAVSSPPAGEPSPLAHLAVVALEVGGPARQQYLDSFYAHAVGRAYPLSTELIAVDLGRDLASMRSAHPDAARTLVLYALVVPVRSVGADGRWTWRGGVSAIQPDSITVPRDMRAALSQVQQPANPLRSRYSVTLCVGVRGEPWIESVRPR